MDIKSKFSFFALMIIGLTSFDNLAHGGRTDASGCHNDRKNGGYHCHGAKPSTTAVKPATVRPATNVVEQQNTQKRSGTVYYKNCAAARAAGAAPVLSTDPGYGKHLDRDGDGIGCE